MTITMQNAEQLTRTEMQEFVEGSRAVQWTAGGRQPIYDFLRRVLEVQQYQRLRKGPKGIVRRCLLRLTGLSRAQLTRLIRQWLRRGCLQVQPVRRHRFPGRYTRQDIALLAAVDASLSGPAAAQAAGGVHPLAALPPPHKNRPSLPQWEHSLSRGVPAASLHSQAPRHSDTAAARQRQRAKGAVL